MKEIYELKGRGYSAREIARTLRLAHNTVMRYLNDPEAIMPSAGPLPWVREIPCISLWYTTWGASFIGSSQTSFRIFPKIRGGSCCGPSFPFVDKGVYPGISL